MNTEIRIGEDGTPCCCGFDAKGNPTPPKDPCDKCKAYFAAAEAADTSYAAPNPYKTAIEGMRAASATDESTDDDKWKAARMRELNAEHTRIYAHLEASPLRTAEGQTTYPAPNGYAEGIKALRERDARALAAKENR